MPQATQRKTKTVKFTSYRQNHGVKESLVWPDPNAKNRQQNAAHQQKSNFVLPKKAEIGKAKSRGYEPFDPLKQAKSPEDEGHVIDALRGWPGYKKSEDDLKYDEAALYDLYRETTIEKEARMRSDVTKKSKKKKSDQVSHKRQTLESTEPDAHIADLISHRYMTEGEKARTEARHLEEQKARQKAKMEYERKFPKDIKATKASQLRSIAMAEKVTSDPKNLWQMSKFKDNAQSHLDTFRANKSGGKSDNKQKYKNGDIESDNKENAGFYTCTCAEEAGMPTQPDTRYLVEDYPEPELEFEPDVLDH